MSTRQRVGPATHSLRPGYGCPPGPCAAERAVNALALVLREALVELVGVRRGTDDWAAAARLRERRSADDLADLDRGLQVG